MVILASNLKGNIDAASARRFQAMVYFSMPDAAARLKLWRHAFAAVPGGRLKDVDLPKLARDHELAGGSIVNVLRNACLDAVAHGGQVTGASLRRGIGRERLKEGRVLS